MRPTHDIDTTSDDILATFDDTFERRHNSDLRHIASDFLTLRNRVGEAESGFVSQYRGGVAKRGA